jgi:catechol 2,3-dioxygenase-like lactoylglutathione lyase family enzyme
MTIQRMEHVGIVVDDLAAATVFFVELGLKLQGEGPVEGGWVDRVVGLEGVRAEIAMVETPDGHGRLELTKFHTPSGPGRRPACAGEHPRPGGDHRRAGGADRLRAPAGRQPPRQRQWSSRGRILLRARCHPFVERAWARR